MFNLKIKSQLHFHYLIILCLISFHFVSSNANKKRFLHNYYDNGQSNSNNNNNGAETEKSEREKRLEEDPGVFLLAFFFIFFFMGLYIICILKRFPEFEEKIYEIWKFMFFANNGILVASFVNMFSFKNIFMDSSPFLLSLIGCGIGIVYYICKFSKNCSKRYAYEYFQYEKLKELFKLPSVIFELISLTDPCCLASPSLYVNVFGYVESDICYVSIWNFFMFIFKKLAVVFSMLSYYIFLIFYLIFWFIGKGILTCCFKCKNITAEDLYSNKPNPKVKSNPDTEPNTGRQVVDRGDIIIGIPDNNFQASEKNINNNNPNFDLNMQNIQNQIAPSNKMFNNGEISEQNRFKNNPQNFDMNSNSELPEKAQIEEAINRQNQNIDQTAQNGNNFNQEQMQQNNMGEMKNDFKPENNMGPGPI